MSETVKQPLSAVGEGKDIWKKGIEIWGFQSCWEERFC